MNKTFAVLLITLFTLYTTGGYNTTAQVRNTVSQSEEAMNVKYQDAQLITFSDKTVKCTGTGEGIDINKTSVKITESGTYIFSGECTDGSITVKKGIKNVVLVLNGLKLTSASDRSAISCNASSEVTLIVEYGTNNELADTEANLSKEATDTEDGTFIIRAGDDAMHADEKLIVGIETSKTGPVIDIKTCYEGLVAGKVYIYVGDIDIASSDDGINAAGKDLADTNYTIDIYGGDIFIKAEGDGLDSNKDINIYGGTVFGAGSGGMITTPASGSQGYISSAADRSEGNMPGRPGGRGGFGMDSTSEIYGSGKVFTILDENSEVVYKTLLPKNVNYYIYSSADIDTSKTYTIDVTDVE